MITISHKKYIGQESERDFLLRDAKKHSTPDVLLNYFSLTSGKNTRCFMLVSGAWWRLPSDCYYCCAHTLETAVEQTCVFSQQDLSSNRWKSWRCRFLRFLSGLLYVAPPFTTVVCSEGSNSKPPSAAIYIGESRRGETAQAVTHHLLSLALGSMFVFFCESHRRNTAALSCRRDTAV